MESRSTICPVQSFTGLHAAHSSTSCGWFSPTRRCPTRSMTSSRRWASQAIWHCIPSIGVPIPRHGDFTVYETSAIVAYIDETFPRLPLQPRDIPGRACMDQWISMVNSYYYPYMIYYVTHERLVFPELGIASDEKVVAHALPKVELGLQVAERQLGHGQNYLLGGELTLADFYLLPSTFAFSLTDEGKAIYPKYPAFCRWRERMEALPSVRN